MSSHYKNITNGRGTTINIDPDRYISVGKDGTDITVRGNGKVIAFDNWDDFVNAIDVNNAAYYRRDSQIKSGADAS